MVPRLDTDPCPARALRGWGRRSAWLGSMMLGVALAAPLCLAGCASEEPTYAGPRPPSILLPGGAPLPPLVQGPAPAPGPLAPARPIAILAPLSGPNAERGTALVNGAELALADPSSPKLDVRDTRGTPEGAAAAAQAAAAAGDGLIIGPLTAPETSAVAAVARAAGIPVLAFTNDPSMQQPGVWTLGVTPGQQARRLVDAMLAQGKNRFAAVLPTGDFGRAMQTALVEATQQAGAGVPTVRLHGPDDASIDRAMRAVSDFIRRGGTPAAPPAALAPPSGATADQAGPQPGDQSAPAAAAPAAPPENLAPPPFDALLLADAGPRLAFLSTLIPAYGIGPPAVRILGPAIWVDPAAHAGASLDGAWFAAPDSSVPAREAFNQSYLGKYGTAAPPLSDIAYDAASIAKAVGASSGGYALTALAQPDGFAGVDGPLELRPDGQVRRGLALFEIEGGGARVVEPAPQTLPPASS